MGYKIKDLREAKKMTQEELAEKSVPVAFARQAP